MKSITKRSLPLEKLMTYSSFRELAEDNFGTRLFKPGDWFCKGRIILEIDDKSIKHIGEVTVCGSLSFSPKPSKSKAFVWKFLNSQFEKLCSDPGLFSLTKEKKWKYVFHPAKSWNYSLYMSWFRKQLPLIIDENNVRLSVNRIDFNVEKVRRDQMSGIRYNGFWLAHLGWHFFNWNEKCNGERIGLYATPRSGIKLHTWWDAPNNDELTYNFVYQQWAVYLPFVSFPFPPGNKNIIALEFDREDFLPNPRKRRALFDILKRRDKSELDAYFAKLKLLRHKVVRSVNYEGPLEWERLKVENSMSPWEKRYLRVKAVTAHQPNSILGQILVEADETLVNFTLQYFFVTAKIVNQLRIGNYHAVEQIAWVGRLSLISRLVCGKLKLKGRVLLHMGIDFKRIWSVVFAAIEVNSAEYLKAAITADKTENLLRLRDDRGVTALGLAVLKNKVEFVRVLLEARAEVNQPSWGEETALCLALQFAVSREIVEELIKAGAKTAGVDLTGNNIREQLEVSEMRIGQ